MTDTFLARDKFDDAVEFRRNGSIVEYRYITAGDGKWREPTWERDVFTPSERAAYQAAQLSGAR